MKAEDIDLEKEQVFETPIEGFEFSDSNRAEYKKSELKAIAKRQGGEIKYLDEELMYWRYCRPIQAPQPKTRPMTHFEILKLDAVFSVRWVEVEPFWQVHRDIEMWTYCLRSDFQKAETPEDVVWKKLEVEAFENDEKAIKLPWSKSE